MRYFIASDIHGSSYWCSKMLECFKRSDADMLLLLGDILYHGPRNDLPDIYAPKEVIKLLEPYSSKIVCVRGNCDTEVDQMVLSFPLLADYAWVVDNGRRLFLTHGHKYEPMSPPPLAKGDVLLYGHTHIPVKMKYGYFLAVNPGSVSIPKEGSPHSAVIYENGEFEFIDINSGESYEP
ncbi:MAG: phosphodiesterase [Ruminococcus sp.]|nr:phosphodiesterase [Ruminococcus sp.]